MERALGTQSPPCSSGQKKSWSGSAGACRGGTHERTFGLCGPPCSGLTTWRLLVSPTLRTGGGVALFLVPLCCFQTFTLPHPVKTCSKEAHSCSSATLPHFSADFCRLTPWSLRPIPGGPGHLAPSQAPSPTIHVDGPSALPATPPPTISDAHHHSHPLDLVTCGRAWPVVDQVISPFPLGPQLRCIPGLPRQK